MACLFTATDMTQTRANENRIFTAQRMIRILTHVCLDPSTADVEESSSQVPPTQLEMVVAGSPSRCAPRRIL